MSNLFYNFGFRRYSLTHSIGIALLLSLLLLNTGCQIFQGEFVSQTTVTTPDIYLPEISTPTPLATPVINRSPFLTWIDPSFPDTVFDQFSAYDSLEFTNNPADALVKVNSNSGEISGALVYLAVVPFNSLVEEISISDLQYIWNTPGAGDLPLSHIYLTLTTKNAVSLIWGEPSEEAIEIIENDQIAHAAISDANSIAIIPFENVSIDWKVLKLDGSDPLNSEFNISTYGLTVPIKIETKDIPYSSLQLSGSITNFDTGKLSSIALTGVTALVRDTAALMEENGMTYPALNIKYLLANASITHISNEVPFAEDCPSPDPNQGFVYFCSRDSYIELLEFVGTDIIELSGDHFGDWGSEAIFHSLDLYHDRGWLTYGGGENLQVGRDPVYIEHNGNSFAFIGCNAKVHEKYATATEIKPGASSCDFEWMLNQIEELKSDGYIVIATMQHEEVDSFNSIAIQRYDFGRLADAGADIVSGSQAHHPQTFEYTGNSFIHYGLGNLFFDQWYLAKYNPDEHANKDKAFIDLHYFYNGTHINTRLIPIQFTDNAQSRLMFGTELESFLLDVFQHSSWNGESLVPLIK